MLLQIARTIFQRRLASAIALPVVLLLLFSGVSLWQVSNLLSALQLVDHTNQVISQANYTQKLLLDLETGARGYILTKEAEFLEPYQKSQPFINQAFQELGRLVADNPVQVQRVNQLYSQYQEWHRLTSLAIENYRQVGVVQPVPVLKVRKHKMDQIRRQIDTFITTEKDLRNHRNQIARLATHRVVFTTIFLTVVIGSVLINFIKQQMRKLSLSYENALINADEQTENSDRAAQRLSHLHAIDQAILSAQSDITIIKNALNSVCKLVNCQKAFLILFDFDHHTAQLLTDCSGENIILPIDNFICATILQPRQTCFIQKMSEYEQVRPILDELSQKGLTSCLTIPMQAQEELIGEICLVATTGTAVNWETQEIGQEIAEHLAIAIQQSRMRQQLEKYAAELEKRVEERTAQLQEVNRELEGFSYSVSHDLRAPLRTIQGFAQALLEDYHEQLDQLGQDYLQYIADGALQMDTLITELLAYSRLSQTQIQTQAVELDFVVNEALNQLSQEIQIQAAKVVIDQPLPLVIGHHSILVQVVINLISNSLKFVKPEIAPFIRIYAEEYTQGTENWIKLWVVDKGIGIAPEHQERIFQPFERLHGVEVYPGTGIGLATVSKEIERMGGFCGVESQLGVGSRFWIALPKAEI